MSLLPPTLPTFVPDERFTLDQWQAIERSTNRRYEFHQGVLVSVEAMAGGSYLHAILSSNVIREFGHQIVTAEVRKPHLVDCHVLTSDLRIAVEGGQRYLYADAAIVCGQPTYDEQIPSAITNPVAVFEVLSPSSDLYDRGLKFDFYAGLESLREYILVDQERQRVEVRSRATATNPWSYTTLTDDTTLVELPALGISCPLRGLYRGWNSDEV